MSKLDRFLVSKIWEEHLPLKKKIWEEHFSPNRVSSSQQPSLNHLPTVLRGGELRT